LISLTKQARDACGPLQAEIDIGCPGFFLSATGPDKQRMRSQARAKNRQGVSLGFPDVLESAVFAARPHRKQDMSIKDPFLMQGKSKSSAGKGGYFGSCFALKISEERWMPRVISSS
jgi:hypothetical protein